MEWIILAAVAATSVLSGILGMAGGIVLMAVLVSVESVAFAMILHGFVQASANGSRALILLRHVDWRIFRDYLLGALAALMLFMLVAFVPDQALVLIAVGSFPFLARGIPHLRKLDITRPWMAANVGLSATAVQLFAGVSGPLVDAFYVNAPMNRYQVIANKAITQTLGHGCKLVYYGLFIGAGDAVPAWLIALAMVTAVLGTRIGTSLLRFVNDEQFRRVTGWVILGIGAFCIAKGTLEYLGSE